MRNAVLLSLMSALLVGPARGQQPAAGTKVQTATRLVTLFTGLETQVMHAAQQNDSAVLDTALGADFNVTAPAGEPIGRDDWSARFAAVRSFRIAQLAARDFGSVVAVSFRLTEITRRGSTGRFVVDLWRKDADQWRLEARYQAPAAAKPATAKPTGKQ